MLQKLLEGSKWQFVMNDDCEAFLELNCHGVPLTVHLPRDGSGDWLYRSMMEFLSLVKRQQDDNMLSDLYNKASDSVFNYDTDPTMRELGYTKGEDW